MSSPDREVIIDLSQYSRDDQSYMLQYATAREAQKENQDVIRAKLSLMHDPLAPAEERMVAGYVYELACEEVYTIHSILLDPKAMFAAHVIEPASDPRELDY